MPLSLLSYGVYNRNMDKKLKRLKRTLAYEGEVVDLYKDKMQYPNGSIHDWDFVCHKKGYGACILPVLPDGRILLIRQYRPAVDDTILEIPAGAIEPSDENTLMCAKRELAEETGYTSNMVSHLLRIQVAVAYCNEWLDIYLARNCIKTKQCQKLDEGEDISTEIFDKEQLLKMISDGQIQDAKTVAAITAFAANLGAGNI